ncbi:hypothetical protein GCM10009799_51770 [Nocardiopsis rhodophaea]|uniref:HTH cro/C1-type domain-containing protein n=1 Tax=Nocardiopsis rhodophaea TaxID=280238 RepID=A0ABN2TQH9_9ACTN
MDEVSASGHWSLANKLNLLFDTVRSPDGNKFSDQEVAAWITEHWDEFTEADEGHKRRGISNTYISYLRRGLRKQVSASIVVGMARFFGVDPRYLLPGGDQDGSVHEQVLLLRDMKAVGLEGIKMRNAATGEATSQLKVIRSLLAQVASEINNLESAYADTGTPGKEPPEEDDRTKQGR